jgi:hypothetical protein
LAAQEPAQSAPPARSGFSIREATVFGTYYTVGLPPYLIGSGAPPTGVGYDVAVGGATTLSLAKPGERTNFSLQYTPSYTARARYSEFNAFSNDLGIQLGHSASTRLRFGLFLTGSLRNREEFQFSPIQSSAIAASPGSLQDLAQAMTGAGTSPMALDAGIYAGDTAAQALFFGNRILSANARAGLDYSISPRLTIAMGISGSRIQYIRDGQNDQRAMSGLLPQVTAGTGDISLSYSLTPRTSISASGDATKQQSRLQNAIISNGRLSIERTIGPHFFVNASGGTGVYHTIREIGPPVQQFQYLAGGGFGYRGYSHTLLASFDRRIADLYGIGASSTRAVSGSWRWAPPRLRAWIAVGFSRMDINSFDFPATTWRGTVDVGRTLGHGISIVGGYSYLAYSNLAYQGGDMLAQNAIRVGLNWMPHRYVATPQSGN